VTRNYWWPRVTRDIRKYVDRYDISKDEELNRATSIEVDGK